MLGLLDTPAPPKEKKLTVFRELRGNPGRKEGRNPGRKEGRGSRGIHDCWLAGKKLDRVQEQYRTPPQGKELIRTILYRPISSCIYGLIRPNRVLNLGGVVLGYYQNHLLKLSFHCKIAMLLPTYLYVCSFIQIP